MTLTVSYYLPVEFAQGLLRQSVGKLSPIVTGDASPRTFQLFDTFDADIGASDRMLIKSADAWTLVAPTGAVSSQPCASDARFVSDFEEGPVKAALKDVSPLRALMPVTEGDIQEATIAFVDEAEKTRVRIKLTLLNSDAGGDVALVTLQELRGYQKALRQAQRHVLTLGAKQMTGMDVYKRLVPDRDPYIAKPIVDVGRKEAAFDAANDIISAYLPIARMNEAGIIEDIDIEFLHDYRIALRKIRSVLSLFAGVYSEKTTDTLKRRFSKLMAPTGDLRDLDVYMAEKVTFYALLPDSLHGGLDQMFRHFSKERTEAQTALATHLQSAAYKKEMDALCALFAHTKRLKRGPNARLPALGYSCDLIWRRYAKVCKIAAGIDDQTEDEDVHRLRIHCKKLRYLMEFFAPVFPEKEMRRVLKPLKRLQDNLGLFNDYSVQQDKLRAMLEDLDQRKGGAQIEIAQSIGALIMVLHRKQLDERAKVVSSFETFNDAPTRASFDALFKKKRAKA